MNFKEYCAELEIPLMNNFKDPALIALGVIKQEADSIVELLKMRSGCLLVQDEIPLEKIIGSIIKQTCILVGMFDLNIERAIDASLCKSDKPK